MNYAALRKTLQAGSVVFGASGLFLLILPALFLELLALETNDQLVWSMRMIGITVFALAANMWNNAAQSSDVRVANVAKVMCVSATALGVLTLMIPAELTWFTYLYAAVGFGFGIAYLVGMLVKKH
jgi:O-antigen/teichoic acid export membrane protein